jgi:hypothetical protein
MAAAKKKTKTKTKKAAGTSARARTRKRAATTKTSTRTTGARKTAARKTTKRTTTTRAAGTRKRATPKTASAITTTDHAEIRRWVESRGGFPAAVTRTSRRGDPGLLRIDYPGFRGADSLERIDWEDFFEKFDESGLAFLYEPAGESRFSKFVKRPSGRASAARRR